MPVISTLVQARVQSCAKILMNGRSMQGEDFDLNFSRVGFMMVRDPEKEYKCRACGCSSETMSSCGSCYAIPYCSHNCQKKDWKLHHRYECKAMKDAYEGLKDAGRLEP